ncbi:MAG: DNA polymerase III subunit delta' [Candidatus Nealsonbacteria bacterium]|nr:DNA polymerase III subunit delta' [Candidatus Nealsonbacteria bacterium]
MEILGHHSIWKFLKNSAEYGKVSHAYLFFGPERVGKKTIAFEFIKLLNCQEKNFKNKPCEKCQSCKDLERKSHPDFILIEPQPEKKEIEIAQIKNLTWQLSLKKYYSPFKAAIIDSAHLMNQEAQNCLLKTLEEPKGQAIIILTTAFPELLLPTIVSRTKRIRFSRVAKKEMENFLKNKEISEEKIKKLISVGWGRPGEIMDFLNNPEKLKVREERIEELKNLIGSPLNVRFEYAKKITQDAWQLKEILDIWLEYFRNNLFSLVGSSDEKKSFLKLKKNINLIQDINFLLSKTEINPTLALENLLLEI